MAVATRQGRASGMRQGFHGLQFLHLKAEDVNPAVSSPEWTSP